MEHSPPWEANSHSTNQEITRVLLIPKVYYRVHKNPPVTRRCVIFRNELFFYAEGCQPLAQLPSWRTTRFRLSATAYSIYSQLPAICEGLLVQTQTENALYRGDKGPHNVGWRLILYLLSELTRTISAFKSVNCWTRGRHRCYDSTITCDFNVKYLLDYCKSRDSSVGVALGYELDYRGSRVRFPAGSWEFFSSPPRPERLWGPSSLLSNGYQGLLQCG
jgi:hypothetical protein